jgi:hypothetical protein
VVMAGNPPVTPEGLWVIEDFGPWLDPRHPRPAKPGELRYFTTIDGKEDVEVDADWQMEDRFGKIIKPKSRTFIPASLSDNPDLLDTDYASTLANLPKHLREAFLEGKFQAQLEDGDLQVIPTEWILMAQQRWVQRKGEDASKEMTSVGVDVAQGGKDRTVIAPLHTNFYAEPIIKEGIDTKNPRSVASAVMGVIRHNPQINVDCDGGYGGGVVEHMESNEFDVRACKGSASSGAWDRDRVRQFANKRAEWIWKFREALDPERGDSVALPPGRQVIAELSSYREKRGADAREYIQIELKEDLIKRLGRSPDIADAIILAWAEPDPGERQKRVSARKRRKNGGAPPAVARQYSKVIGRK